MSDEPAVADLEDLIGDVIIHEGRVKDMRVDPEVVKDLLRYPDNKYSEKIHRQQMLSSVWRSTGWINSDLPAF